MMANTIQKIIICLGFMGITSYSLAEIEFIDLYNRSPEEISPVINNNFPNIPVSKYGNQLVINGTPSENQQIRELVAQLDTPARRLLITLDTGDSSQSSQQGIQAKGHIQLGSTNSIHGRAKIDQRNTTNNSNSIKQLMVNEGSPTMIQVGQLVPINYTVPDRYGRPVVTTQYQEVMQNLYVTAQVVGQQVFVNVNSQNDRFSQTTGNINQQAINTRVSGALGSWISIGSLQDSNNYNSQGITGYSQRSGVSNTAIRLKVDLAN
ncbi:secretin N-terminal domain-containing protein [Entomomonas asaccharolytica]|uniref:NolW-like domain-containing protein n=1 Tax=Entomomonas asaccharolytica TaxID=2785331 RepID=A0A974NDF4_9GAMM|nr:secretin N-terminal domain-containing protein [Entomomonas asaccharolytica]QQP84362.1 hypothetical protein JHT90_07945 [Entomomonas asaccharolytica]